MYMCVHVCAHAHAHLRLTLCDPMDCKPARLLHSSLAKLLKGSGLPFPSPGDLPDQGIEPKSPLL